MLKQNLSLELVRAIAQMNEDRANVWAEIARERGHKLQTTEADLKIWQGVAHDACADLAQLRAVQHRLTTNATALRHANQALQRDAHVTQQLAGQASLDYQALRAFAGEAICAHFDHLQELEHAEYIAESHQLAEEYADDFDDGWDDDTSCDDHDAPWANAA